MLASVDSKIAVRLVTTQLEPTSVSAAARLLDRSCAAGCCQLLPGVAAGGSINTPQLSGVTNISEYIPLPGQMRTCTPIRQFIRPVQINIARVVTVSL